jgi:hypothetical protein
MNRWFTRKDMDGESKSQSDLEMISRSLLDEPCNLYFSQNQTARNDVVKGLLLFSETCHCVADPEWDKSGNNLAKITAGRAPKRNSTSLEIGNN